MTNDIDTASKRKVGDRVYFQLPTIDGRIRVRVGEVTRVTPSGQFVVLYQEKNPGRIVEIRFSPYGREYGSKWYSAHIIDEDEYNRLYKTSQKGDRRKAAERKLAALAKRDIDGTSVSEFENLFADALAHIKRTKDDGDA